MRRALAASTKFYHDGRKEPISTEIAFWLEAMNRDAALKASGLKKESEQRDGELLISMCSDDLIHSFGGRCSSTTKLATIRGGSPSWTDVSPSE